MAGYTKLYAIGGGGGFMGSDGINPILLMILVGESDRQWLEPHYFSQSIRPMGKLKSMVPAGPDHPDALLDACIAFFPEPSKSCKSYSEVVAELGNMHFLDFHADPEKIPSAWKQLRKEARPIFKDLGVWKADFVAVNEE